MGWGGVVLREGTKMVGWYRGGVVGVIYNPGPSLQICRASCLLAKSLRHCSSCLSSCSGLILQVIYDFHGLIITTIFFSSILRCLGANFRWLELFSCNYLWQWHLGTTTSFFVLYQCKGQVYHFYDYNFYQEFFVCTYAAI